ncbi:hypothetical protein KM043_012491 [Ampulex compressa]|nr:hypothetical protein KM043_012491 [Ampulex compressa]
MPRYTQTPLSKADRCLGSKSILPDCYVSSENDDSTLERQRLPWRSRYLSIRQGRSRPKARLSDDRNELPASMSELSSVQGDRGSAGEGGLSGFWILRTSRLETREKIFCEPAIREEEY